MNRYMLFFASLTCIALHALDPRLAQGPAQQPAQLSEEQLKAIYPTKQELQAAHKDFPFIFEYLYQQSEDLQAVQKELIAQHAPLIQQYTILEQCQKQVQQLEQTNNALRALADEPLQKRFTICNKHHGDLVNTYLPLVMAAGVIGSRAIVSDCSQLQDSTILQTAGTMLFNEYIKKHPSLEQYSVNMSAFGLTAQTSLADVLKGIFLNAKDSNQLNAAKELAQIVLNIIDSNIKMEELHPNSDEYRTSQKELANQTNLALSRTKDYLLECARIVATHQIKQSIALSQTTSRKLPGTDVTLFHDAQIVDPIIGQGLELVTEYIQGRNISAKGSAQNIATDISNELIYNAAVQLLHAVDQRTKSNDGLIECLISKDCQTHSSSQQLAKVAFDSLSQNGKIQVLTTSTALAAKTITNQIEQPIARIAANATVDTTTELAHTYITEYIASHHLPNVKQISIASLKEFSKNIFIEGTYTAICPLVHKLVNEHGQKIGIKEEHIEIFFPKDTRPKTVTHMLTALLCKYGTNLALSAVKQRMAPVITNNTEFSQRILSNIQILTSNTRQKSTQSYSRLFTVFVALNSLIGS